MSHFMKGPLLRFGALACAVMAAVALSHSPAQAYLPGPTSIYNGGTGARTFASAGLPIYKATTASLDFPSISAANTAGSSQKLTIALTGAAVGDVVILGPPADFDVGLVATGFVSATNVVTVQVDNAVSAAVNPSAAPWHATVLQQQN